MVLVGTLAYELLDSNKLFRPYCGGEYMAVLIFEPFEAAAAAAAVCEKKYESLGIFRVDMVFVFVEPFIMATDNGFGESERTGETGPIEFKWPLVVGPIGVMAL